MSVNEELDEVSVNEELDEELHKPVTRKLKKEESMRNLTSIFGQQISLKWYHCLLRIEMLNIYYVWLTFSPNMPGINLRKVKKVKVLNAFIEIVNESAHLGWSRKRIL